MTAPTMQQHDIEFDSHPIRLGDRRLLVYTASCHCGCGAHWSGVSRSEVDRQVGEFLAGEEAR